MIPQPDLSVPPEDFVGRKQQMDAFRQALQQGLIAGRTSSFAVLGEWGIGKTSLFLKFAALCAEPEFAMLPVFHFNSQRHSQLLALRRDPARYRCLALRKDARTSLLHCIRVQTFSGGRKRDSARYFATERQGTRPHPSDSRV